MMEDELKTSGTSFYAFRVAFVAAIGGFLFGFDLGMIGSANIYLREQFHLNDEQFGFATASAVLGCILGPGLGAWLCDRAGRNRTMIVAAVLLAVSALFTAIPDAWSSGSVSQTMLTFNIFRFIGGIGVGLCSVASPMYIAEISPSKKRGTLGLMYQVAIVVGHAIAPLIAFGIVYILRTQFGVSETAIPDNPWLQAWRWMFASEAIFVLAFVAFVFGLPDSPRWLAEKGRIQEARNVLASIEGADYADREIEVIKSSLATERGYWSELLSPGIRYALLIGLLLSFFNNWTGWSVIAAYIPRLFELAGFDRELAIVNFFAVYGAMSVMTLVSLVLMDRVGRRPLWMFASLLMAVITFVTGIMFHLEIRGWPMLVVIALVTVPHGLALGGIPWLMMSELFPTRLRAKAVSVTTTVLWVFIFAGAYLFPMITGFSQQFLLTNRNVSVTSNAISFSDSDPDQIAGGDIDLAAAGFRPMDQVTVRGTSKAQNSGTFSIAKVPGNSITLDSHSQLADETPGSNVTLQIGSLGPAFWLFSIICILSFLFGWTMMPETKGRSLEEIGASWQRD